MTATRAVLHILQSYVEYYLEKRYSLRELEQWLVANLQAILDSGDETAIALANQIDAALVELSAGATNESALQERLAAALRDSTQTVTIEVPRTMSPSMLTTLTTASTSQTSKRWVEDPGFVVDFHLTHQFA